MKPSDPRASERGRGTVFPVVSSSVRDLIERETEDIILRETENGGFARPPSPPADPYPEDVADFELYLEQELCGWAGEVRVDMERYMRAFPGTTIRDWKGKGDPSYLPGPAPDERPWQKLKLSEVRALATRNPARTLPHNVRQAAARDPALIWNPLARRYRLRPPCAPAPSPGDLGRVGERSGGQKVAGRPSSRPAAAQNVNPNTNFLPGCGDAHDT